MCTLNLSAFSADSYDDSDRTLNKKSRRKYINIARELYGQRGAQVMQNAKTEFSAERILHDLRMGVL